MESQTLVSIREMAKILDVKPSWIYQRTRLGQKAIPHVKLGKYVRFDSDEVIAFFAKKEKASESNYQ